MSKATIKQIHDALSMLDLILATVCDDPEKLVSIDIDSCARIKVQIYEGAMPEAMERLKLLGATITPNRLHLLGFYDVKIGPTEFVLVG